MSSVQETRNNMNRILTDDVDACIDIQETLAYSGSVNDAWLMTYNTHDRDVFFRMWFIQAFAPRDLFQRAERMCREVDNFWRDMQRAHKQDTGEVLYVNPRITSNQKCRLLTAMWPSWKDVVYEAKNVNAIKAKINLDAHVIKDGRWLVK